MKNKLLGAMIAAGAAVGVSDASACGSSPSASESNKGNYLCTDCGSFDTDLTGGGIAFIKSTVNVDIARWVNGNTVTLTNGSSFATYMYSASGNFVIVNQGQGIGSGTPRNHDGGGKACPTTPPAPPSSGGGGGSGANYAGTYTPPDTGYRPDLYDYNANTRTGTVTVEEVSAYYSNYYSNYYANYYSNMNSCFYC